jgi:hypothetical protein
VLIKAHKTLRGEYLQDKFRTDLRTYAKNVEAPETTIEVPAATYVTLEIVLAAYYYAATKNRLLDVILIYIYLPD